MTWTATRPGGMTGWVAAAEGQVGRTYVSREQAQAYADGMNDAEEQHAKWTANAITSLWEYVLGCMDDRSLLAFMRSEQRETGEGCSEEAAQEAEQRGLIVWPEGEDAESGTLTENGKAAQRSEDIERDRSTRRSWALDIDAAAAFIDDLQGPRAYAVDRDNGQMSTRLYEIAYALRGDDQTVADVEAE